MGPVAPESASVHGVGHVLRWFFDRPGLVGSPSFLVAENDLELHGFTSSNAPIYPVRLVSSDRCLGDEDNIAGIVLIYEAAPFPSIEPFDGPVTPPHKQSLHWRG